MFVFGSKFSNTLLINLEISGILFKFTVNLPIHLSSEVVRPTFCTLKFAEILKVSFPYFYAHWEVANTTPKSIKYFNMALACGLKVVFLHFIQSFQTHLG